MRKVIVLAVREYQAAVRSKAFIIGMLAMPVFMGGSIAVQLFLKDKVDVNDKLFAVVDRSGLIYDALQRASQERDDRDSPDGIYSGEGSQRKQVLPRFVLQRVDPEGQEADTLAFELSERVRNRELFAFLLIDPDIASLDAPKQGAEAPVEYHSNNPTYRDAPRWLSGVIDKRVRELRIEELDLDPAEVRRATRRVGMERLGLLSRDESGRIREAEKDNELAGIFVPMGFMMLMFAMIMLGAQPLLHSVLEEKNQRIAEVLLGSIPPFQLMMGKLIGMVAVSLTMVMVYLCGAAYAVHRTGQGHLFPTHLVVWFVIYQSLAILMFGSLFGAIGAAVSDFKESQGLVTPVMLVVIAPLFVWIKVVQEPNATSSVIMSLIPPATPMLMIARQCTPAGVPMWQPLLGIGLVLLTTIACVFVAGRVFRVGILMQGKGAKIGELMRWVLRG